MKQTRFAVFSVILQKESLFCFLRVLVKTEPEDQFVVLHCPSLTPGSCMQPKGRTASFLQHRLALNAA